MNSIVEQINSPKTVDIAEKETVNLKQTARMKNMNKLKEEIW